MRMSDWIDKLHDEAIARSADDAIAHDKYELAKERAPYVHSLVRREIDKALSRIRPGALEKMERPLGVTRIRTQSWPLQIVEYSFLTDRIQYEKFTKTGTDSSEIPGPTGSIRICVEFNSDPWFEHDGRRLFSASEVVECLLSDLFKHVIIK